MKLKMDTNYIAVILSCIFVIIILFSSINFSNATILSVHPNSGQVDLSSWDQRSLVQIDGEWMYFPNMLKEDIKTNDLKLNTYVEVPHKWTPSEQYNGRNYGYGTYYVTLSGLTSRNVYGMRIPDGGMAYQVTVNDTKIIENGVVARNKENYIPHRETQQSVFVADEYGEAEIVIEIANYDHVRGGFWASPIIGSLEALDGWANQNIILNVFIFTSIFIMGVFFLVMHIFSRDNKSALYFGLLCIFIALRVLFTNERLILSISPSMSWHLMVKLEYIFVFLLLPISGLLLYSFQFVKSKKVIIIFYKVFAVLSIIAVIFLPFHITYELAIYYIYLTSFFFLYFTYQLAVGIYKRVTGVVYLVIGVLSLIMGGLLENFVTKDPIHFYYGNLVMIFFMAIFVLSDYATSKRMKQYYGQIEEKNAQLEQAEKAKSQFLSNMSHEIRTPLNSVIGMSDLLEEYANSEEEKRYIKIIQTNGNHLLNLINNILDFSKLEAKKMDVRIQPTNVAQLIEEIGFTFKPLADKKGIKLNVNSAIQEHTQILMDEDKLRQILINLVGNAIKFTDKGEVFLSYEVIASSKIVFFVKDTGIGMNKEDIEKIFENYSQNDSSTRNKIKGTGLGLSISKQLIELLNGRIWVESEEGVGSTFYFELPITIVNENEKDTNLRISNLKKPEPSRLNNLSKMKILLVDDVEDNKILIQAYLKKENIDLDLAKNGYEAVEKYKENVGINTQDNKKVESLAQKQYSLILMDIQMPIMDGYEATKEIRNLERKNKLESIPIIALSAYGLLEEQQKSIDMGCNEHIIKPVKKNVLLETIKKYS